MRALAAALFLIAAPVAAAARSVAGLYEIDQMEMAGGLELRPDGQFRYALEYGAVSEEGAGDWTIDDKTVVLTSNPMPSEAESDRGYGLARFNRTRLMMEHGNLILWRWDARIVFRPVQPLPR